MPISYHRFAGSSLNRLAALSDGVFAVAMTLLVLDLKAPSEAKRVQHPVWSGGGGGSEHALLHGLLHQVAPRLLPYLMSFLTLGIFWVGQQTQLESFTRSTRALTWIHLTFLLAVTLLPFSTAVLAQDTTYRLSMGVYCLNLFALGLVLLISLGYGDRAGLLSDETTRDMPAALKRRIVVYQCAYALAALTCLINTYLAIGLLVALQLNSVIAPRIGILDRAGRARRGPHMLAGWTSATLVRSAHPIAEAPPPAGGRLGSRGRRSSLLFKLRLWVTNGLRRRSCLFDRDRYVATAASRLSKMTLLTATKITKTTNPMRSRTSPKVAMTPPRPKP